MRSENKTAYGLPLIHNTYSLSVPGKEFHQVVENALDKFVVKEDASGYQIRAKFSFGLGSGSFPEIHLYLIGGRVNLQSRISWAVKFASVFCLSITVFFIINFEWEHWWVLPICLLMPVWFHFVNYWQEQYLTKRIARALRENGLISPIHD